MTPINRWLLCLGVVIVAAASPAWLAAENMSGGEWRPKNAFAPGGGNGPSGNMDGLVVSEVRIGRHPGMTRIVLDLDGEADFPYHIDETGRMIVLDLQGVEWMARQFSKVKVGVVDGYVFNRGDDGAGYLGIAASVPVRIKDAFRLPPDLGKGHRFVMDLAPLDPAPEFMMGQDLMDQELVSPGKTALLKGRKDAYAARGLGGGTLTEQDKAIESKLGPVRVVMPSPPPFLALPGQPRIKCRDFPQVAWWRNNTHREAANYVVSRHRGDWGAYLRKWERHLDKIADAFVAGKKAFLKAAGVTLNNEGYIDYIGKVEERISIIRCLAREKLSASRWAPR